MNWSIKIIYSIIYTLYLYLSGLGRMYYDCTNDYNVCGPAGHYNKWLESESTVTSVWRGRKINNIQSKYIKKNKYIGLSSSIYEYT